MLERAQRGEHVLGVTSLGDGDRLLEDQGPGIDAAVDEVDAHSEQTGAVGQRLLDGAQAGEGGQERRVDVDHGVREAVEEARTEELHIAGEHDQTGPAVEQPAGHPLVSFGAVLAGPDRKRLPSDAGALGPAQGLRVGAVRGHADDPGLAAVDLVD